MTVSMKKLWIADDPAKCRATFAAFAEHEDVADLLICDEPGGHVGLHLDTVARKAWKQTTAP